jgi:hypothetical protein
LRWLLPGRWNRLRQLRLPLLHGKWGLVSRAGRAWECGGCPMLFALFAASPFARE